MNCTPGPLQWVCQLTDKALSGTSPDSQESLALLILLLFVLAMLVRTLAALYTPIHPLVSRVTSKILRRPVREHIDEHVLFKAQLEQQAALTHQNQQQLDIMRQSFALSTDALISIRDLTAEVKRANDLETDRIAMRKADLAVQGAHLNDMGTRIDGRAADLAALVDATGAGIQAQMTPIAAGISRANDSLTKQMAGLNMLDQRMTQHGQNEAASIVALRETLLQRFDTLPAALASEIRPLVEQWSGIERSVMAIREDLKAAEQRVVETLDRVVGSRESWVADLAASAQGLGASKGGPS